MGRDAAVASPSPRGSALVPLVGGTVVLVFTVQDSQGPNAWDDSPNAFNPQLAQLTPLPLREPHDVTAWGQPVWPWPARTRGHPAYRLFTPVG